MSDGSEHHFGSEEFRNTYKDWQAIRIIRDNYYDNLKIYFAFYSWFIATMVGALGFLVSNHRFEGQDASLIGWLGIIFISLFLAYAVFLGFYSKRVIRNIRAILERTNDAAFLVDKLLYSRAMMLSAFLSGTGLVAGLVGWVYVVFFYYKRHV